jgi:hypothetical protein
MTVAQLSALELCLSSRRPDHHGGYAMSADINGPM